MQLPDALAPMADERRRPRATPPRASSTKGLFSMEVARRAKATPVTLTVKTEALEDFAQCRIRAGRTSTRIRLPAPGDEIRSSRADPRDRAGTRPPPPACTPPPRFPAPL